MIEIEIDVEAIELVGLEGENSCVFIHSSHRYSSLRHCKCISPYLIFGDNFVALFYTVRN